MFGKIFQVVHTPIISCAVNVFVCIMFQSCLSLNSLFYYNYDSFATKISHLLVATCQDVPSLGWRSSYKFTCSFATKKSHLLMAICQDVPSLGGGNLYKLTCSFATKISHLLVATSQDVDIFRQGRSYKFACSPVPLLPRCLIFWWLSAKMFHL